MLILQRKAGQSLLIGENIKISITEIGPDRVKISIDAPKEITVLRTELLDAADANRQAASSSQNSVSALKNMLHKKEKP